MDSSTDSDKILQRKKLELLQEEKTIKRFLNEDFDDGSLQNRLKNYRDLFNNLAENGMLSNREIDEHRNNVSEFEFGVAKLIKNTKQSNAPKSSFDFQNVRASNALFNIDGDFTGKDINMTYSLNSLPKHQTGFDNVLFNNKIMKVCDVNLSNVNQPTVNKDDLSNTKQPELTRTEVIPQSANYYQLVQPNKTKGYCLILNYENFIEHDQRIGTEKDATSLETLFKKLNFKVKRHDDLSKKETKAILANVASLDCHSEYSCFVLCILSHGNEKREFCCYDDPLSYSDVLEYFNVSSLTGKPKLFFIQACQGDKTDRGVLVYSDAVSSASILPNNKLFNDGPNLLPTTADRFIFYSSYDGHYSYRYAETGSLFIQALVKVFDEDALRFDLSTMCDKVKNQVANMNTKDMSNQIIKQMPTVKTTLRKGFRFYN